MGRRSQVTHAQKCDEVLAVLSKKRTIAETSLELGIAEPKFARWRKHAADGMEWALSDKSEPSRREHVLEK